MAEIPESASDQSVLFLSVYAYGSVPNVSCFRHSQGNNAWNP